MKKHGFIYLWYDKKHKRYYIGCRWGHENDGYICSSSWMKQSFKRRPHDFKRKILKTNIPDKKTLLEEEYKWLSLIKDDELGKKYYNLRNHRFNHWASTSNSSSVGQKIKDSRIKNNSYNAWNKGLKLSEDHRKKLSEAKLGKTSPRKGVTLSEETRKKISQTKISRNRYRKSAG